MSCGSTHSAPLFQNRKNSPSEPSKHLTQNTISLKSVHVVANAFLRESAQTKVDWKTTNTKPTTSQTRRQSKFLTKLGNTIFTNEEIYMQQAAFQAFMQSIADYLAVGCSQWFDLIMDAVLFYDSPTEGHYKTAGPSLSTFNSSSMLKVDHKVAVAWNAFMTKCKSSHNGATCIPLPV